MDTFNFELNARNEVQKGNLLLAEPLMQDPNFGRTVILMCDHDEKTGSFGLVMNNPTGQLVKDLTPDIPFPFPVFSGGPVEKNTLHFIHKKADLEGATALRNGLFWGGNLDDLVKSLQEGELKPHECRFFVGYSGWGSKQLEGELKRNSWIIARVSLAHILEISPEALWKETLNMMGGKYKVLSNYPVDPLLN